MSNTAVENEVVRMQFDNRQFEAGVKQSMSTLDKLKAALHLDKSAQGFKQIGDAAKKVNFSPITNGVEAVKRSFTYMDVAFATAVARMTNDAITAGKKIATALTIDPVKTGLSEYETKLNAIQVMKSNRGGSIEEITEALDELNKYADKTIYNFTQMTNNVGKFVAQGMKAKEAANAVQGLANLAGASGASAEDMARATYQMSQAMGGTIRKIDWNSLRNANMATMQLKDVLKEVAKTEYGVDVESIIKAKGTFEDSLEKGWLTGDIFTEAMQMYSDAYDEAELKRRGYNEEQIKMFKELAKEAADATTSVKTLSQLWDVIKETAQSGWTQSWEWIIGDLDEAKRIWTSLNNMISGYIDKVSTARNKLLEIWATGFKDGDKQQSQLVSPSLLTGREEVLLGLSEFMHSITAIVQSIRAAFRDIFPPMTGRRLVELSYGFRKLMQAIKPTYKELENIFYAVRGVLSVVGLFRDIIAEVIKALFPVFSTARDLNEIILQAAGFIGNLLYATTKWLRESGTIHTIVAGISKVIGELLKQIGRIIVQIFRIVHETGLDKFLVKLIGWIGNGLVYAIEHVVTLITKFADILERVVPKIKAFFGGLVEAIKSGQLIDYLVDKFKQLGKAISDIGKGDGTNTFFAKLGKFYSIVIDIISNAVVATYKWAKSLDLTQGIAIALSLIFGTLLFRLSSLVKAMTIFTKNWSAVGTSISKFFNRIKLHNPIILELAIFVGILAASLKLVSTINTKALWNGVFAIVVLAAAMSGFGLALAKVTKEMQVIPREQIMAIMSIFLTMSIVMMSLSKSVKLLSSINFWGLTKGVLTIGVIMAELIGIAFMVTKFAPKLTLSGAVMLLFASTLTFAVKKLTAINWQAFNSISKNMLWTATWLGAAALALGIGTEKLALSMSRIAIGLAMIAGAIYLINSIKIQPEGMTALGASVSAMVGIVIALGWAGYVMNANDKAIKQFSKGVVRITVALGLMVLIMKMAEIVKHRRTATKVLETVVKYMAGLILELALLGAFIGYNTDAIKALGGTMLLISIAMSSILLACVAASAIALIPGGEKVLYVAAAVLTALTISVGVLIYLSKYGSQVKMMPILALMMGIAAIFTQLAIITGLNWVNVAVSAAAMVVVLIALGKVIDVLSKIKMKDAAGQVGILLSFTAFLLAFSSSLYLITKMDFKEMGTKLLEMGGMLVALAGAASLMAMVGHIFETSGADFALIGVTLLAMTSSLLLISAALAMLPEEIKIGGAIALAGGLIVLIGVFAVLGKWGAIWGTSITTLAASITVLGKSLFTVLGAVAGFAVVFAGFAACFLWLSTMDITNGILMLSGLVAVMYVLAGISPAIYKAGSALLYFGAALLMLAASAVIGGFGITSIAIGLEQLANIGAGNLLKVGAALSSLVWPMAKLALAGVAVLFAVPGLLGIAGSLALLGAVDLVKISAGLNLFTIAIASLVPDFMTLIGSAIGIDIFAKSIRDLEPALLISATAITALVDNMNAFIGIKDAFISASNQIGIGLEKGLVAGLNRAQSSMKGCANNLISTFCSILGIHSPSRVFRDIGIYMMQGLAQGEKEGSDDAKQILVDNAKDAAQTMETTGCQLMGNSGRKMGETWVNDMADEMDKGKTNSKITTAAQNTGRNASNKTASIITATASIVANAAANSGNAAGAAFVNAMAGVLNVAMPQIANSINGMKAQVLTPEEQMKADAAQAYREKQGAKLESSTDWSTYTYKQLQEDISKGDKYMAEAVRQHFGGTDTESYKAWRDATSNTMTTAESAAVADKKAKKDNPAMYYIAKSLEGIGKSKAGKAVGEAVDYWTGKDGMGSIQNAIDENLSIDWTNLTTGYEDYSTKVQTARQVTEEEFKSIEKLGNLKVKTISDDWQKYQVAHGNMDFTAEALRNRGYEWDASTKTWRMYFSVTNKDGKEQTEIIQKETSAVDGLSDSMSNLKDTTKETESEMETFTKALNSNLKSAMNYFDEFKYGTEEDKISKKDLLKNLEEQHNGMISWAKDMQELASRGMAKDLWKNLAEEGPASYAKVKAFLDMTASELQSANEWFARDLALPDVTTSFMEQIMGSYYGDYSNLFIARGQAAGEDLNKGTKEGLEKNLGETKESAKNAGSQVADSYCKDGTGEGSPSWKTREAGQYMNLGLIEGIKNNLGLVTRFAAKCGDTIVKSYSRSLNPKEFRNIGKNAMVGLYNGIVSEVNRLFKLVQEISYKIPHTIKGTWEIKSPSRLFKSFGMYAMEGLALGLSQYSTLAEAAASETADNTTKTLNGITNSVLDWDTDFNPVITPTLNLDNVTRGVREINDMFKETTLDTVVEEPDQNGGATAQPSTTFIQNNYSPKHLSSIDIYRQTRNQLSSLKGAMG